MPNIKKVKVLIEVPDAEKEDFKRIIKDYRKRLVRSSETLVNEVFTQNPALLADLKNGKASEIIERARELVWQKYLVEEELFNTSLLTDLGGLLNTPKAIIKELVGKHENLVEKSAGEYAGRIYPYIYQLSLSNTNSRRSRSGSTFQYVIYQVYKTLDYKFDSQKKVGNDIFSKVGLGKVVDSVLPGVKEFEQNRRKTIIGTMKTSLRERWQEVVEEIHRTNIPQIFLLTMDDKISM